MSQLLVTDRSLLRFAEETKTHFAFLEAEGFRCVHSEETLVKFESPELAINIYHGRQSCEIGIEIESTVAATDHYPFSALLLLVDREQDKPYRNFSANSAQEVSDGIRQLAENFQRCLAAGILNDDQLFSRLKLQRQEISKDYALEVKIQQARRKAEVAWHNKDYATVVRSLKPFRGALAASEVAKLEFSEKHR